MVVKDAFPARNLQLQKPATRTPSTERSDVLSTRRSTQSISMDQLVERYNLPVGQNQHLPPMGQPGSSRSRPSSRRPSTAHQMVRQNSNGSHRSSSSRERPQSAQSSFRGQGPGPNNYGGYGQMMQKSSGRRTNRSLSSPERSLRRQRSFRDNRPSSPELYYSDAESDRGSDQWVGNPGLGVHGNRPATVRLSSGGSRDTKGTTSSMEMSRTMMGVSQMLKDKIRNKAASSVVELRHAFQHFNRDGDGEISFEEFLQVLREQHITMSETEARALFKSFDTDNSGSVSFDEFQNWLYEGADISAEHFVAGGNRGRAMSISKQKMIDAQERTKNMNNRLNKEDMERLDEIFREKLWNSISEGSTRVLRAFRRIHTGRGLVITYEEFKRALKEHALHLSEEEVVEFWDHFQPMHGGADFNHFRQWLVPQSELERPVTPPDPRYKDQVLRAKIKSTIIRAPYQLMRTFRQVKTTPGSSINKAEFGEVVKKFGMTFTPVEIDAFFDKFDEDRSGEIDYMEFCNWITESHSSPLASINLAQDDKNIDKQRMARAMERGHRTNMLHEKDIANFDRLLREKILGSLAGGGHELLRAFRKIHTGSGPVITFVEFKKAVLDFGFTLHDDEIELMFSSFSNHKKGGLDYKGFCTWIMDSGKQDFTSIAALQCDENNLSTTKGGMEIEEKKIGSVDQIKQVIRQRVNNTPDGPQFLMRAFLRGHRAQGLDIPFSTFKQGLEQFSVRATDIALLDLFAEYDRQQTGMINYKEFVMSFQEYQDEQREKMKRNPIGVSEAEYKIRDLDRHRPGMWQASLESADTNLDGLIAPQQLRKLLDAVGIHMLDWDFEKFIGKIEQINGMILYADFLEKFTDNHKAQALRRRALPNSRQSSASKSTADMLQESRKPLISEEKIKDLIYQRYKGMMKTFLGLDFKRSGYVSSQEFRSCLSQHGITQMLSQEELSSLITKHGVEENGRISYTNFLQHFMVTMRGRESGTLGWTQQKTLQRPKSASQLSEDTMSSGSRRNGTQNRMRIHASPISRQDALKAARKNSRQLQKGPAWKRSSGSGSISASTKQSSMGSTGNIATLLQSPSGDADATFVQKARHLHALLKPTIIEIWKPLRQEFKKKSVSSTRKGEISVPDFRSVLQFNGLAMTEEDFGILTKVHKSPFDISGRSIKYDQFLKSCLGAQADWL